MPCLSTERIAQLDKQLAAITAQIDAYNATLLTAAGSSVGKYDWQDGGGRQAVTRKSDKDIFQLIERLQAQYDRLYRIRWGTGNPRINTRAY